MPNLGGASIRYRQTQILLGFTITIVFDLSLNRANVNVGCSCLFAVIRAKVVGQQEVDVGNDIYGNPIKRIKYDIKQIKVCADKATVFMLGYELKSSMNLNVLSSVWIVRCSKVPPRISTSSTLLPPLLCAE